MRTFDFTCRTCGKRVTETVPGFEACPDRCAACRLKGSVVPFMKLPERAKPPAPLKKPAAPAKSFSVQLKPVCPKCKGRGRVGGFLCPACEGSGVKTR